MDIQAVVGQGSQLSDPTDTQATAEASGVSVPTPTTITAAPTTTSTSATTSTSPTSDTSTSNGSTQPNDHREPLTSTVAKLFGKRNPSPQDEVQVSYRVSKNPNEIVTVFTDPKTGQEITQFPSEMMIELAQFFEKESGVAVDKSV